MHYQPTRASLNSHPVPAWYEQAKFGIFIHWGLFSIPGFAPNVGKISDAFKKHYDQAIVMTPYTEWYANAIKVAGSPSAAFHRENYGTASYADFKKDFDAALENWDADAWADSFKRSGARYVVLVTKHHDGFCLWPSAVKNPHQENWTSTRDIVGEMAAAVRKAGLRFGVYYSGGIDWTFKPEPVKTLGDFFGSLPGGDYPEYAYAQVKELIDRYQPDIVWNDIGWPTSQKRLDELFAYYYNKIPDGVVNDRWMTPGISQGLRFKPGRIIFDACAKAYLKVNPSAVDGFVPPPVPHCDFRSPEYTRFPAIQKKKWESTRGMSHSFGFNRHDSDEDYASGVELLSDFIDGVAKNGNLLLNVGPRGIDATIPLEQLNRLEFFGAWLARNGSAIYGVSPWRQAEALSDAGLALRFTVLGHQLNLIVLGYVTGQTLRIKNIALPARARLLADNSQVNVRQDGADTLLEFAQAMDTVFAPVITFAMAD